jgi:UDPglucose--hexose-1-phosphate uridylyltransferase
MPDFSFLKDSRGRWVISAPKRSHRPDQASGGEPPCPFEILDGKVGDEEPIFMLNQVKVLENKYPFTPIHEVIIHSDDHRKNIGELDYSLAEDIFKVYHLRFNKYKKEGQVYIFHNQGRSAGESLPHPHSQLTVVPRNVELDIPHLITLYDEGYKSLSHFKIFCPHSSQWPDEVWIAPNRRQKMYWEVSGEEVRELSFAVSRLVQIYTMRYGVNFPFNFYIYPGEDWYLRLIPRIKVIGGFEVGTGVFVNTQDPSETFKFISENFDEPDFERIKEIHQMDYKKAV